MHENALKDGKEFIETILNIRMKLLAKTIYFGGNMCCLDFLIQILDMLSNISNNSKLAAFDAICSKDTSGEGLGKKEEKMKREIEILDIETESGRRKTVEVLKNGEWVSSPFGLMALVKGDTFRLITGEFEAKSNGYADTDCGHITVEVDWPEE